MKNKNVLGGILASIAALMGIIGHMLLFIKWYVVGMHTPSAEPGCEILLNYIHPFMADLGILAGVMFAVSAYGFFTKRDWAYSLSVVALVPALLGSWFINVPYLAAGLPPVYFILFWPYVALYFLILKLVGKASWSRTLLALLTGIAFIFADERRRQHQPNDYHRGTDLYLVQKSHWVAMLGWAVVTAGIILKGREWMRMVGIISAVTELVVGIPLAIVTAEGLGRFSLFALGPIACLALLVILVWPGLWQRWSGAKEDAQA
jgi:hypothetical protein